MRRIAIVEDEPSIRANYTDALRRHGYEVAAYANRPAAMAAFRTRLPDLALVDMDRIETQPLYDPISQLVYATGRQHVTDVWIDGERKLRDGVLVDIDTSAVIANAHQWRERIAVIGRSGRH